MQSTNSSENANRTRIGQDNTESGNATRNGQDSHTEVTGYQQDVNLDEPDLVTRGSVTIYPQIKSVTSNVNSVEWSISVSGGSQKGKMPGMTIQLSNTAMTRTFLRTKNKKTGLSFKTVDPVHQENSDQRLRGQASK